MSQAARGAAGLRTAYVSGPVAGLTDAQLLERFVAGGDGGASFDALLARHGPMVWGVCRALLRDEHAADDAFQATFLVLVRKAGSVRAGDSLGRWLYGVARKVAVRSRSDALRRNRRERAGTGEPEPAADGPGPDDAERADLREALHDALAGLPEPARAAIVLCHLEGLTHEEAARRLGWPVGTVRSRLARGRDRLRARLARRGFAPASALADLTTGAVPERLLAATRRAAATLAAGSALDAAVAPASVLSLTTGVLHAMTLAKLNLAALVLFSAALLGLSGAVAFAYQSHGGPAPGPQRAGKTDQPEPPPARPQAEPGPTPAPDRPSRPAATTAGPFGPKPLPAPDAASGVPSPQEFAAQLDRARRTFEWAEKMHARGAIAAREFADAGAQVQIWEGRLAGRLEDLEDELEQLRARKASKLAELKQAVVRHDQAQANLDRLNRVNERIKGAVSNEDLSRARGAADETLAVRELRAAGLEENEVLIRQVTRKIARYRPLWKPADPTTPGAPEPKPTAPPPPGR